jgi:hypothetical protein
MPERDLSPDPGIKAAQEWNAEWQSALDTEEERSLSREAESFLDGAVLVARFIRDLTADRDDVPGSKVMGFIINYGLEKNPKAAIIAKIEYGRFLHGLPDPIPSLEVDTIMLQYYAKLESVFLERGVAM